MRGLSMEAIFTALVAEVANRSLSFLIGKCSEEATTSVDEMLQRLLLRIRVIVEEAEERSITNQAMIQQLNMLRKEMYRGYYALDSFRGNQARNDKTEHHNVSYPFALSKSNPLKYHFLSIAGAKPCVKELEQVSTNLQKIIIDMGEFITFLKNYSPRYHEPYSMHLILDKCMFGRQMEMERVMNFLMQMEPSTGESIGVLPIIGSAGVGKSTLVAHVYNNYKVRDNFSRIVLVHQDDLKDIRLFSLEGLGVTIHQKNPMHCGKGQFLIIVELSQDVDEPTWNRLYIASAGCLESGTKIIVTSRSKSITNFGTTQALILNILPIEAFWYFFKVRTFGSVNPEYQPNLESIALEIARGMNGSFIRANITSSLLRNRFSAQYWLSMLSFWRKSSQRITSMFAEIGYHDIKPQYFRRRDSYTYFVLYGQYQINVHHRHTVPKITLQDILSERVKCQRRSEVVAWESYIPPYNSHIYICSQRKSGEMKKNVRESTYQG